ncbi:MAG: hypothetical protein O7B99_05120 [Planctomycetota bacterium]|nr:hypothetical protein [Planctomycetota bacterium]
MERERCLVRGRLVRGSIGCALGFVLLRGADLVAACLQPAWSPGAPVVWVADRDGGRVVGLDEELYVARSFPLPFPVLVAAASEGGAWVACARSRGEDAGATLVKLSNDGEVLLRVLLVGIVDLVENALGEAVAAHAEGVVVIDGKGGLRTVALVSGVTSVAVAGERILVGCSDGWLLHDEDGLVASARTNGTVTDVAPASSARWWSLVRSAGGARLALLSEELDELWHLELNAAARELVPTRDATRTWVLAEEGPAWLVGPGGRIELEVPDLSIRTLGRGAIAPDGCLFSIAPGAVLELDPRHPGARAIRSQGGFDYLVDAAAAEHP